ncbi:MAG: hypothetical protein ACLS63_07805 [Flavonifractor plautii]
MSAKTGQGLDELLAMIGKRLDPAPTGWSCACPTTRADWWICSHREAMREQVKYEGGH